MMRVPSFNFRALELEEARDTYFDTWVLGIFRYTPPQRRALERSP